MEGAVAYGERLSTSTRKTPDRHHRYSAMGDLHAAVTAVGGNDPSCGPAHVDRRDRALADYSEALRLNPKYAGAMRNRGIVYARKRDDERAIRDYSEAARLDPDDPHALIGRAFVYCEKHEFARGSRFRRRAAHLPTCPPAVSGRAAASIGNECR